MITLVTGSPGAGKTLYVVKEIVDKFVNDGRPIYTNIDGFDYDHPKIHLCDKKMPFEWIDIDHPAIFIFDEVQEQYTVRHASTKVPEHISKFEIHRHRGHDFILITQGPRLLDRHLFPLIEAHTHLFRSLGLARTKVSTWGAVNESPQPPQNYSNRMAKTFVFPKKYFQYYKSAQLHTARITIPWKIVLTIGGGFAALGLAGFMLLNNYVLKPNKARQEALEISEVSLGPNTSRGCFSRVTAVAGNQVIVEQNGELFRVPIRDIDFETGTFSHVSRNGVEFSCILG